MYFLDSPGDLAPTDRTIRTVSILEQWIEGTEPVHMTTAPEEQGQYPYYQQVRLELFEAGRPEAFSLGLARYGYLECLPAASIARRMIREYLERREAWR